MATTIVNATLTTTISESVTLNNQNIVSENQYIVSGINEFDKRIMTIPISTTVNIVAFSTIVAGGTFISGNVRWLRITNKDDTNFIRLRVTKVGADTFDLKLEAGKSFVIGNTLESVSATGGSFSAFQQIDNISAQADTAPCDIEYFIATI